MAKISNLHEMIDVLSEFAGTKGETWLKAVASDCLESTDKLLRDTLTNIKRFENQDFSFADDGFKVDPEKKYHNELPTDNAVAQHLSILQAVIWGLIETMYKYGRSNNQVIQGIVVDSFEKTEKNLNEALAIIEDAIAAEKLESDELQNKMSSLLTPEKLQEIVLLANEFDKSGDPLLMKQAAVLDEILLTIGAQKAAVIAAKRSQDLEIARLKALAENKEKDPYTVSKEVHDKSNRVAEAQKEINKIKEYRPMESPLNTRTCPDHPGAQMARVAEHTYQCSLDKSIYNYETGYTTMKGNNIPGGSVSNQTQSLYDRPNEFTSFETRENKLNPIN
jgi:hypothetical protein